MKKAIIMAIGVCVTLASCQGSKNVKNFSEIDSLSYAIGMDLATNFGVRPLPNNDSALVVSLLTAGFRDAWNGKSQITTEDASAFIQEFFQVRLPAKIQAENLAWFEEIRATNPNVQTAPSGLMFEIMKQGDQAVKASADADQVVINFRGTLRNGTEFDRRDSASVALYRSIRAWSEGIKLIGKGGEITLWAPANLAYGSQGNGPMVPPNSPVKYEIELLDVIPAQ